MPLWYCPYYKLEFYFKQQRFILLSSWLITKIHTHPLTHRKLKGHSSKFWFWNKHSLCKVTPCKQRCKCYKWCKCYVPRYELPQFICLKTTEFLRILIPNVFNSASPMYCWLPRQLWHCCCSVIQIHSSNEETLWTL